MMNTEKRNNEFWNSFNSMFQNAFAKEMKTDIIETDKEYILEVEVPGVAKENIELSYLEDTLTIHVKQESNKKDVNYLAKERTGLDMTRTYYLEDADENQMSAKLSDGILTITLAKVENKVNPKKVITIE